MAEYITKEETVLALLEKGQSSHRYKLGDIWELNGEEIREAIASIPAADVKPVVRCGECKYWVDDCCCEEDALLRPRNFFCADGEKRAE